MIAADPLLSSHIIQVEVDDNGCIHIQSLFLWTNCGCVTGEKDEFRSQGFHVWTKHFFEKLEK